MGLQLSHEPISGMITVMYLTSPQIVSRIDFLSTVKANCHFEDNTDFEMQVQGSDWRNLNIRSCVKMPSSGPEAGRVFFKGYFNRFPNCFQKRFRAKKNAQLATCGNFWVLNLKLTHCHFYAIFFLPTAKYDLAVECLNHV